MAMSRDQLLPSILAKVNERFRTPHIGIILTGTFMIAAIVFLDIDKLVKTASTLQIILFILVNISVIIMRESKIQSYRPRFKSPLYPYMHIAAIIAYAILIVDMGAIPLAITAAFFGLSATWYIFYVRRRVSRASAAMHVVERVTDKQIKTVTLEDELRDILLERDEVIEDRFDKLVRDAEILDIKGKKSAEQVFNRLSQILEKRLDLSHYVIFEKFLHREAEGGTVVQPGFAIPHIIVDGSEKFDVVLVRAKNGIVFPHAPDPVKVMFVLVGSKDQRNYHLRALMAIAQIAQEKDFQNRWLDARGIAEIRNIILLSRRKRDPAS
jgi:mannitol/fructose-specific phosphotransferase system IIA component (Ntr-type)